MTDNDIIKALEEHYRQLDNGYSDYLCYGGKGDEYAEKELYMLRDVLDLINRQKAEIDRYKNAYDQIKWERDMFEEDLQTAKAEIERLNMDVCNLEKQSMICDAGFLQELEMTKAEAIKEFAKKIKDTTWYSINSKGELVVGASGESDVPLYRADDILEIAKELVGDNE